MSSTLNQQLLRQTDAIILRPNPVIRRPRHQELRVVVNSGPLTVIQVRTAKGKIAFMLKSRPTKYAYPPDFKKIANAMFKAAFPNDQAKLAARQHRYYLRHKEEILENQRQRRAKHNLSVYESSPL